MKPRDEREFLTFVRAAVSGRTGDVRQHLTADPLLATHAAHEGAARGNSRSFFFTRIRHYLYAGDTALHMAAAACHPEIVELLIAGGSDVQARNRMGATPLHYAADANHGDPRAQAAVIEHLLAAGADPNVVCKRGVTPLHRAVRNRSSAAVRALLAGGANPRKKNGNGSTPQQLARWTTGKSGSGSAQARAEQAEIIRLLLR